MVQSPRNHNTTNFISTPATRSLNQMPICEICGMEVTETHECVECASKFCDECGDTKLKLCYDCLGWEDDVDEDPEGRQLN